MQDNNLQIKHALVDDIPIILTLIKELAEYESLSHEVTATENDLQNALFGEKSLAKVIIGYFNANPVSVAVYFYNFSTFTGKYGIYLEDLYVKPEVRNLGIGKSMLQYLISYAKENNCGRLEWCVLNWNKKAKKFYEQMGAKPRKGWSIYRLEITRFEK